jgi:hypothetical protein
VIGFKHALGLAAKLPTGGNGENRGGQTEMISVRIILVKQTAQESFS